MLDFLSQEQENFTQENGREAGRRLAGHLLRERQVGDLLKLDYNEATIIVHDRIRQDVGGLPLGCFLVATRLEPGSTPEPDQEDTSLILLRVLGPSALPNQTDTDRDRFEAARRAADRTEQWDDQTTTDQFTLNMLRFAGLRCRVLGTFLLKQLEGTWEMCFGPDLANFYSGRGMKVYKPDRALLSAIVNYVTPQSGPKAGGGHRIPVGRTRYAASERPGDDTVLTSVKLDPGDLLARRTALFGMSRTGKSNTTKIIAAAVFGLRQYAGGLRVGQLILDPNGEYANDNSQDKGSLRGIASRMSGVQAGDVKTYGLNPHPNDPGRQIIKLNFFGNEPKDWSNRDQVEEAMVGLIQGKELLDDLLSDQTAIYISNFRNTRFEVPVDWDRSSCTRYKRVISAYRALLALRLPAPLAIEQADLNGLTNEDLRKALASSDNYKSAADTFNANERVHWDRARSAWTYLGQAMVDKTDTAYKKFNQAHAAKSGGRDWHDETLRAVLNFLNLPGGMKLLSRACDYHERASKTDYAEDVVEDLQRGRLVIIDQSTGSPEMNKSAAERLVWRVFRKQVDHFIYAKLDAQGQVISPPDVMIYIEEAHNLLPAKSDDLTKIWSRVAKEGSKFRIGMVYATQEPSSIQANILKNTDNWFVAHLNNTDELRELKKYYDFEDFAQQILTVPEPGFLRMRTLSNPYTVPVQIDRFQGAPRAL